MKLVSFTSLYDVQNVAMAFSFFQTDSATRFWTSGVCKQIGEPDANGEYQSGLFFGDVAVPTSLMCPTTLNDCLLGDQVVGNLFCLDVEPTNQQLVSSLAAPYPLCGPSA
jgi:hypothetical protein